MEEDLERFKEELNNLPQDFVSYDTLLDMVLRLDEIIIDVDLEAIQLEYDRMIDPKPDFEFIKRKWMKNQKLQIICHLMEYAVRFFKKEDKLIGAGEETFSKFLDAIVRDHSLKPVLMKYRLLEFGLSDSPIITNLHDINIDYFKDLSMLDMIDPEILNEIDTHGTMLYRYAAVMDSDLLDYIISIDSKNPKHEISDIISKIQIALDDINEVYLYDGLKNLIIKYFKLVYKNKSLRRGYTRSIHELKITDEEEVFFRSSKRKEKILMVSAAIFDYADYIYKLGKDPSTRFIMLRTDLISMILDEALPARIKSLAAKPDLNAFFSKK